MALGKKKKNQQDEELEVFVDFEGDELTKEERQLLKWRTDCLVQAGVDRSYAVALATSNQVDVHEAERLKAKGCSDKLLYKLLR